MRIRPKGSALALGVGLVGVAGLAGAWTPLPIADDPLVRMPGTQSTEGVVLDAAGSCTNCHAGFPTAPVDRWQGSMMAQAARDPLFWAAMTVAAQDSIWALGRPNAADLCLRCHSPGGWLGGRSDPPNGSALTGADFDGVTCEACHKLYDPFFEDTYAGTREGDDWAGYWDEANASGTPSSVAALTTRDADRVQASGVTFFDGDAFYGADHRPVSPEWDEHASGQYFVAASNPRRASFADANANHAMLYSRHHKSRHLCGACHDVSNPVLANLAFDGTPPGDGDTVLPSEQDPAFSYGHIERTFSEMMLSDHGVGDGAPGSGAFAPGVFDTSRPGNAIATCQDCHMPDASGVACNKNGAVNRPGGSAEHPQSGQPLHDLVGGNAWIPWILASTVPGSPNHDATNEALLGQGAAVLTLDLAQGLPLDPVALLDASDRAITMLESSATIEGTSYVPASGALTFRVRNHTGHKLPSGYPEGRRMFVNVRVWDQGSVVYEVNPYDDAASTLRGLGTPSSPALGAGQVHQDALVFEIKSASALTGESETFHMALATSRTKDNRIPPRGFRIAEAAARLSEPVANGVSAPSYFSASEYAGGYDDVSLVVPTNADGVEVRLYYQTTSREYVEFLRDEIDGTATTLDAPAPSGEASAYVAQTDPFFAQLRAWGGTIEDLWLHNRDVPGAAPVLVALGSWGTTQDPCDAPGAESTPCDDGLACTASDACTAGTCVGQPVQCVALDECHDVGTCDPGTGVCSTPAVGDGVPCTGGSCEAGVCVPAGAGGGGAGGMSAGGAGQGGAVGAGGAMGTGGMSAGGAGQGGASGAGGMSVGGAGQGGAGQGGGAAGGAGQGGAGGVAAGGAGQGGSASTASGGSTGTGGTTTSGSGGTTTSGGAGGADTGGASADDAEGGCSCDVAGAPRAPGLAWMAGLVALGSALARRRGKR